MADPDSRGRLFHSSLKPVPLSGSSGPPSVDPSAEDLGYSAEFGVFIEQIRRMRNKIISLRKRLAESEDEVAELECQLEKANLRLIRAERQLVMGRNQVKGSGQEPPLSALNKRRYGEMVGSWAKSPLGQAYLREPTSTNPH